MSTNLEEPRPSRFVVGIDLGTTNSAVCFVDTENSSPQIKTFATPQLVAAGSVEAREILPSFHYQPATSELATGSLKLPWQKEDGEYAVGFFARDQGAVAPGRLVASAKSWLCHTGVDRTADLVPWHGADDVERLSPVEVAARYLRHIRAAWDAAHRQHPLAEQDLVITLPASFDEVARELTVQAAAAAGLPRVILIEEPQAAFYSWIDANPGDWDQRVQPGQKILVCDIGGGTSDFTLIRVRRGEGARVQFHRVAVGEHLILGGDNLDLALAHQLENRLTDGDKLPPRQFDILARACRQAKETLLDDDAPESLTVNLPTSGSKLIGGGLQIVVSRDDALRWLVEGFFPAVGLDDKPQQRQSGFQEFGLPYAADPAVTRYLASFLTAHRATGMSDDERAACPHDPARPDIVLFNGAVFESGVLKQRILESLRTWFGTNGDWQPTVLANDRLDLAVARGAAYYGMVRRGEGVRIAAGLARSYYVGVDTNDASKRHALCLVPGHAEPGQSIELTDREFSLLVAEPVEFPLFISSTRLTDRPGELVEIDPEHFRAMAPIHTVLKTQRRSERGTVRVHLHAAISEIGTLDLWCRDIDQDRKWRLQFDVRGATQTDIAVKQSSGELEGVLDEAAWDNCRKAITHTFDDLGTEKPARLIKQLARSLDCSRWQWPMSLLRRIWDALIEQESGRRKSEGHEARWLNLLGFALRPGYGYAMDDWRVAETWRLLYGKLAHAGVACRAESRILWRRIAGGLSIGQQRTLADPLLASIRGLHHQAMTGRGRGGDFNFGPHEASEIWRLLGSLELLPVSQKDELARGILDLLPKKKFHPVRSALVWTLGRLGARTPAYGPLNAIIPPTTVENWFNDLLEKLGNDPIDALTVMQLARRTDDRYRDFSPPARQLAIDWLEDQNAPPHYLQLVRDGGTLDTEEQNKIVGEALPTGLRIQ
jgi:hypothetical protein